MLTIIYLLHHHHEQQTQAELEEALLYNNGATLPSYKKSLSYEQMKNGFAQCINFYFGYKDHYMKPTSYKYLNSFLKQELFNGGIIITTNYDVLAERILNELDLWNLHDGYGFDVNLEDTFIYSNSSLERIKSLNLDKESLKHAQESNQKWNDGPGKCFEEYKKKRSKVKVFKLHGSIGWLEHKTKFVMDMTYLRNLLPQNTSALKDKNNNPSLRPSVKSLILPTYIKSYEHKTLLQIWAQATKSIQEAEEIHFIGYSLPEYDYNIRTLLLPLRNKSNLNINVYIMKDDYFTEERWKNFLGNKVNLIKIDSFKSYCEQNFR